MNSIAFVRLVGWLSCALVFVALPPASDADPPVTKHVLLLHQPGGPGPFRGKFDIAFVDAIRSGDSVPIDLYEEAIETSRFPGPNQFRLFTEYLKQKYVDLNIDVIVAQGGAALEFARQNAALFGNPPIVAISATSRAIEAPDDNITGLQGGYWINGTMDLALSLLPDTQSVIVIDGGRENSLQLRAEVEHQLNARNPHIDVTYLADTPLADVVSRVASAPDHSVVFFVRQTMRTRGQDVNQFEALDQIQAASRVPIFSQVEELMGKGVLAGYVWRFENDARRMAEMARRIVNGVRPDAVRTERATYVTLVDWRQLQRWHIPASRLPAAAIVQFKPQSFFQTYRLYVIVASIVFFVQFGLISGLLIQRAQRRRAEEQTRSSQLRYRSVVDTQSELICRFLPDTTLTFVNDAYCRFWNTSRDKLLGRKFIDLIPPTARKSVLDRVGRLVSGTDSHEHEVLLPDGTVGWHHWINQAIVDDQGRLMEVQGVGRDITDRVRAQEALGRLEARNSAMLRAVPDLMFVMLRDGTYVDYHARDPKLLFAQPSDFLGKKVRDVMPRDLADIFMNAIEHACETNDTVVVEYELKVDEVRSFEARLVQAGPDRVLTMVRDVSDTKRAMEMNRHLAGRLIASQERERQRIARELHDDLSQKIALLNIELDQAAGELSTRVPHAHLQSISARIGEIANDVHNLSHELHPSKLQTLGLVAAIQSMCRDISAQRQVQVAFDHGLVPQTVDSDVSLCVYRIVQEALHNVSRHSRAPEAHVYLTCEHESLTLRITDSGVGFDPQQIHTGLGLVSMRERVAYVRGHMSIQASPNRGTQIEVRVPLAARPRPARIDSTFNALARRARRISAVD